MAGKIKIKTKLTGDVAEIKSLMLHPMETGSRKDPDTGEVVPAHYITQLTFANNGKVVMVANFSTAVSKNPYFGFKFSGASAGDTLKTSWVDNVGGADELETTL
ncbi:MAG: thiosulfate oxidation carrier complex protein SoxZ [Gammaproteobacteria bacterium]|nr:thiosulfate oxidation carrier complex protein SoxZ [Gammaproteobacteria bacterium]